MKYVFDVGSGAYIPGFMESDSAIQKLMVGGDDTESMVIL
jgi:hypothetical protein